MIQRIQSVWLFLAILLTFATIFTPLFTRLLDDPAAWILSSYIAAGCFSIGLSKWAFFNFKNRPKQAGFVGKAMIFQIITIGVGVAVFFTSGPIGTDLLGESLGLVMLVLALVFQFLARNAILKDENLVKSIDRIR